jgi:lipid II:glycine glycyltransferase (peptidoglycan interpeptide bridge formation enzyme)
MPFSNKSTYRQLCEEKPIPLFMQAWWMDAVCGTDTWDVLLSEKEGNVVAVMPYLLVKKFLFRYIIQPMFTQYNGVWIDYPPTINKNEKLVFEQEVMTDFIKQLERMKLHYFNQNFHKSISSCLPFIEQGFTQTTRYTYILEDISNPEKVYDNFRPSKKSHIKKSRENLRVDVGFSADDFYAFHTNCLKQKGEKILYSKEIFMQLYTSSLARNQGEIICIADKEGGIHAALFTVWDAQSSYYLITAIDNNYKSSGASSLMVWEAIKFLSDKTQCFDFEGSMIENVAKSFSEFGSVQTPYINISKDYSLVFKLLMRLRR